MLPGKAPSNLFCPMPLTTPVEEDEVARWLRARSTFRQDVAKLLFKDRNLEDDEDPAEVSKKHQGAQILTLCDTLKLAAVDSYKGLTILQ